MIIRLLQTKLQPIYSSTDKLVNSGISNKVFRGYIQELLQQIFEKIEESLSSELIFAHKLIGKKEALLNIHFPTSPEMLEKAQYRLKFEELFFIQLQLVRKKLIKNLWKRDLKSLPKVNLKIK